MSWPRAANTGCSLARPPHNGHSESFTALLEMVDDRRFSRGAIVDEQALREVTVRRLKSDLPEKNFKPRVIRSLPFEPADDEQDAFARLDTLLTESARRNGRQRSGDIVAMLLKKRFLSSPWAFAQTMRLYDQGSPAAGLAELEDDDAYAELLGSDGSDEEEGLPDQPELRALRGSKRSDPLVAASASDLADLAAWGYGYQHRPDARLEALIRFLDGVCRPDGRSWSNERVVVFTEYAATLEWLLDVLTQRGYAPVVEVIQGSTPVEARELVKARFTEDPSAEPVRVLLATDAAGEGIDLQAHCHRLVNVDIPFNPSRLEQRIGRIDRYGQRETPEVYHLVPVASASSYAADLAFLGRIAQKVGTIATDLGSVNQVIDADIQAHFSRVGAPRSRTAVSAASSTVVNRALAGSAELNRQLTELSRTYVDRKAAMHLTPDNARRVVDTALSLTAQPRLNEVGDDRTDVAVFAVPALGSAWQAALRGLDTRLRPGEWRPITFDDAAAAGRTDLVHVHLGHALLQKSARILRHALVSSDADLHRVTAVTVPGLAQSCVAAVSRLVLVGRGGVRLHEEVFLTGLRIRGRAMAEGKVEAVLETALDAADLRLADEPVRRWAAEQWRASGPGGQTLRDRLLEAMAAKAARRQQQVEHRLEARQASDVARAEEIFGAFRRNLAESLRQVRAEAAEVEEMLIPDDQQAQRRRDIRAMEERLATLADEQRREVAAITERYTDVRPHVSAAAVVFAISAEELAAGRIG